MLGSVQCNRVALEMYDFQFLSEVCHFQNVDAKTLPKVNVGHQKMNS